MFPFLMTLNFWAMFALIEVQSLLWMRKGWTERYNVMIIIYGVCIRWIPIIINEIDAKS